MSARDDILAALARLGALSAAPNTALAAPPVPAIAVKSGDSAYARFTAMVKESLAELVEAADAKAAMAEIAARAPRNTPIAVSPHPNAASLDWTGAGIEARIGASRDLPAGVSMADAAIAETGSLLFFSGANSPVLAHFLPDIHFALVKRSTILPGLNDALALARARAMPSTVNFITGPSRSGDIEQTLELGAHGPRQLVVIVLMDR
ncbi:MAG TPA: lactate utilization protein [Micropepsaceae bacterium]|nr:lactate utilization protein [Micropepsaceae bacterium]